MHGKAESSMDLSRGSSMVGRKAPGRVSCSYDMSLDEFRASKAQVTWSGRLAVGFN